MSMGIVVAGLLVFVAGVLLAAGIAVATGWHEAPLGWICCFCGFVIAVSALMIVH